MSEEKGGSGFLTFMVIITFLIAGAGLGLAIYLFLTKDTSSDTTDPGNGGGGSGGNTGDTNDSVCRNTCASLKIDGTMTVDKGIISAGDVKVTKQVPNIFDLSATPTLSAEFIGNVKRLDVVDANITNRINANTVSTNLLSSNSVEADSIVGGYRVVPFTYRLTGNYNIEYYLDQLGNLKSKCIKTGESTPIYENKLINYHYMNDINGNSNFTFIFNEGITNKILGFTFEFYMFTTNNNTIIMPSIINKNGRLFVRSVLAGQNGTNIRNGGPIDKDNRFNLTSDASGLQYSYWKVTVIGYNSDNGEIDVTIMNIRYQS